MSPTCLESKPYSCLSYLADLISPLSDLPLLKVRQIKNVSVPVLVLIVDINCS